MPLHRNANTPPPKPGYFMVFIYPQVVHSVVFTTIFFVSVVSICTTVTEKNQSHSTHHTEHTSHHHHGRRRPRPLPPSVAVHCRFWHKARPRHIVAGFRHARFCIFPRGLVSSDAFFHQCSLMRVFSNMTTCLPPPLLPPIAVFRPFRRDSRPPHIMADARNVRFVLFRAVGAARGAEMRPIENREGRGTLAFVGRHLNIKFNNQPKVRAIGGEDIREGARLWRNVWGGRFPIVCGG